MGCELSNGLATLHSCNWVYNHAKFGWMIEILIYIALAVGLIIWISWVTKTLIEYKKAQKTTRK